MTSTIISFVTQRRNSVLLASAESCVRCGQVAFRRDDAVNVRSLTDRTTFIPYISTFQ